MDPKILVMGEELNYHIIKTDHESVRSAVVGQVSGEADGSILDELTVEDESYSAMNFLPYGGTIPLETESITRQGTLVDAVYELLCKAKKYAGGHGSNNVLLQNLQVDKSGSAYNVTGLAQLLIERPSHS